MRKKEYKKLTIEISAKLQRNRKFKVINQKLVNYIKKRKPR
jgi:hypothetical protein